MYKRSELRHACFRAKKNAATEENKKLTSLISPLLNESQRFENFADVWDILIDKSKQIIIIKPESNLEFIKTVCQEKSFQIKYKTAPESTQWTDRYQNIVTIVEAVMLENLMTWESYGSDWGVEVDPVLKHITTKLFVKMTQKEVTEEMIIASMDTPDSTEFVGTPINTVEAKPMSKEDIKKFEKFLKANKD